MRHRSKHTLFDVGKHQKSKARTSSTLTKKMLHSKSTYFYRWGSRANDDSGSSAHNSANRLRCASAHLKNRTRRSLDKSLYSGMTERKGLVHSFSYLVPSVCALALLIGGIVAINPQPNRAYAEEGNGSNSASNVDGNTDAGIMPLAADSTISLRFNDDASFTAPATANEVAYITNTFTVNVNKYANYTVKLNAMNGSGTELRGKDNAFATIKGVGTNKTITEFTDDTWGYSYKENPSGDLKTIAAGLRYNSMPAYGSEEAMVTKNLTGTEENLVDNYLLAFAAKISSNSPADHYIGNFLLSVVGQAFTPETYYLTYNANSGTGGPNQQSCTQTSYQSPCNIVITNEVPTRVGYTFLGWADSVSAGSAQYSANSSISLSKSQTLYAVWSKDTVYTLKYNMNSGTGTIPDQTHTEPGNSSATSHTFTISATKPTRTGYTFLGWGNNSTDTSASYQPSTNITVSKSAPTKTLYAVWKQDATFATITTMQEMTSTICSAATPGQSTILEDTRDGKKYYVTRTADGNCWMTQNLAYDGGGIKQCELNGGTSCSGWPNDNDGDGVARYAKGTHTDGSYSSIGNFYSWEAAMNGNTSASEPAQGICPNNWQLPTSNNTNSKSFGGLTDTYSIGDNSAGSTKLRGEPLYFQGGGNVRSGSLKYAGTTGNYWSSTPKGTGVAYNLFFNSRNVYSSNYDGRYLGCSVRCIAK